MKKISIIVLALIMALCCIIPSAAVTEREVSITIDGQKVVLQKDYGEAFIDKNNRTMVPLKGVMEAYGAEVDWNGDTRVATVEKNNITVEVPIGESYILRDGTKITNDTEAVIKEDRTYLPIRVVLESFGAGVGWDKASYTVVVRSDGTVYGQENYKSPDGELHAMWISFLEFNTMPKDQAGFQAKIDEMFDRCVALHMNAVIVQVRPDCDAMYPSQYYPWSKFASGTQGQNPGYDPMAYMVQAAHSRNLEFHAWLNPYRVTGSNMTWNEVAATNPAKVWLTDADPSNDRWVLLHNNQYYLNPAVPEVRTLVVNGVKEIVEKYDVDGIHFDDYFYPTLNDSKQATYFDKPEYDASSADKGTIVEWRRNNVNMLVRDVYAAIKSIKSDVVFGISPMGNVANLRSSSSYFVDIDTWMSQSGYVDYIMPQLYWGFERRDASGNIAPYAYENNLKTWIDLKNKGSVKLYIGFNVANAGTKVSDGNGTSEWLRYNDILKRQLLAARDSGQVSGYAFFRYAIFDTQAAQAEVNNLMTVLQ